MNNWSRFHDCQKRADEYDDQIAAEAMTRMAEAQVEHIRARQARRLKQTEILGDIVLDFFSATPRDATGVVIGPSKRRRLDAIDLPIARLALRMFEVFSKSERLDLGLVTDRRSLVSNGPDMAQNATRVVTPSAEERTPRARDQLSIWSRRCNH